MLVFGRVTKRPKKKNEFGFRFTTLAVLLLEAGGTGSIVTKTSTDKT